MRCSICGAKLKKEGDICSNCYKEYQEEETLKKDVNEVFKLKRKYSIAYVIRRYIELLIIFILCLVIFLFSKRILEAFLVLLIFAGVMGILLFLDKRVSAATRATFYETKVVYNFKFLFFNTTKVVKYSDITDISYYQTLRQKSVSFGDICIYAKGAIPGATLLNGFQVKNVENVEETLATLREIVGLEQE